MTEGAVPEKNESVIQDMAAWVLRVGVIASVAVMLLGLAVSCLHGIPTVSEMNRLSFSGNIGNLLKGLLHAEGASIIEAGILILVSTPIIRVAVSMSLFLIVDRDWFYGWVTFVVLVLTVSSLLFLRHI